MLSVLFSRVTVGVLSGCIAVGAILSPVALPQAAAAETSGCVSEEVTGQGDGILGAWLQPGERCDDEKPPVAEITSVTPALNAGGFVSSDSLTFHFTGSHTDGDTDKIDFECQLYTESEDTDQWSECSSPMTYTKVANSSSRPYTFAVRAIDAADKAIDAAAPPAPGNILNPGQAAEKDVEDVQMVADTSQVWVDTRAPDSYIFGTPFDAETPQLPMLTTDSPTFRLAASELEVQFTCTVAGKALPCRAGNNTFRSLPPGTTTLRVDVEDRAGNMDSTPAQVSFTVPRNIPKPGPLWTKTPRSSAVAGDVISTSSKGARFFVPVKGTRELRIIASRGPSMGVLQYRLPGLNYWIPVKLGAEKHEPFATVVLRNEFSQPVSGNIEFKVFFSR